MTVRIDYTNMLAPTVGGGIAEADWAAAATAFRGAHLRLAQRRAAGELGFFDLPSNAELLAQCERFVNDAPQVADVVVLGIGGSALGPIALRSALRPPLWNELPTAARGGMPRLHVLDNVDPVTIDAILGRLGLAQTRFIVTSKSGGTAETMAQFLIVRERLLRAGLEPRDHIVFVTDPEKGALRVLAAAERISALDVPANVGGRFSVLSPVGVLPAMLIGIDVAALLAGAGDMFSRCETDDLARNPAGCFATLQWTAHNRLGANIQVLMPYTDALRELAAWFVQLWAESLGKIRADGKSVGPTPLAALGATDQHSQVQLFMEGPPDKTVTFVSVSERDDDIEIPAAYPEVQELGYLGGHSLGDLIDIECKATAGALARRGRPNMTIVVDRIDAWHVGALIGLFQVATVYAGALYDVNPLDQPGVELGKQFTYAALGRPGSTSAREEWESISRAGARNIV